MLSAKSFTQKEQNGSVFSLIGEWKTFLVHNIQKFKCDEFPNVLFKLKKNHLIYLTDPISMFNENKADKHWKENKVIFM